MTAVWDGLVADAVLGTERRPYTTPDVAGGLGELMAAAGGVLDAVGAVWAYEEVGRLPAPPARAAVSGTGAEPEGGGAAARHDGGAAAPHDGGAAAPDDGGAAAPDDGGAAAPHDGGAAAPDDRPLLPAGTLRSLGAIVAEPHLRPLLAEWLELAGRDGRRLPPEWLPALLDLSPAERRPQLEAAGGPRCAWLAAQRPDWASGGTSPRALALARAVLAGEDPAWDASDDDRLAAFSAVRSADPAAARGLAERVWADEPPATRAAMVARFAPGLSADDEPFLEARLQDRRKAVRVAAAGVLARLPASRYAQRTAAEARQALTTGTRPTAGLLGALPDEEARSTLLGWLARVPLGEAVEVLTALPVPWPAALTDAVMAALAGLVTAGDDPASAAAVRDALPRFALAADARRAGAVAEVAAALERLPDDRRPAARLFWGRALTSLNALVHFRQAMQQEFSR